MDLKAKIEQLQSQLNDLGEQKERIHEEMKEVRKKISKYETVLKHAEEIESLEEEKPTV